MHLANVGVQAAQFLERAAAVHALEEWLVFILKEDKKLLVLLTGMFVNAQLQMVQHLKKLSSVKGSICFWIRRLSESPFMTVHQNCSFNWD